MRSLYPLLLCALLVALVAPTVGLAILLWRWGGPAAAAAFLVVPAAAMLVRAVVRREPRPWAWAVLAVPWAFFVWIALPVALGMTARGGRKAG